MDFELCPGADELRGRLRAFLEQTWTPERERDLASRGDTHDPRFTQELREHGFFAAGWPVEQGGGGHDPLEELVITEELQRADAPTHANGTSLLVARSLLSAGTDQMKRVIVPQILRGEVVCVLGFSEPEAGSDVANAQCRAVADGDEWVINGSKMFTTNAHLGDFVFLLTRTNTEVAKHKGLTTFLVPLDHPGVEVQAVQTLSGERTNITYYNDVRISDSARVGEVDGGWRVMAASLQHEHTSGYGPRILRLLESAETWANASGRIRDTDVRERLARVAAEAEVSLLLTRRGVWMAEAGITPEAEGPMAKLFSSEAFVRASQDLCDLMGPDGLRSPHDDSAPVDGRVEHLVRYSLGTRIYAGTSEIQRNIIAQRRLGLPR